MNTVGELQLMSTGTQRLTGVFLLRYMKTKEIDREGVLQKGSRYPDFGGW